MGIEAALLSLGASAGTAAAASLGATALGGIGAAKALTAKAPSVNIPAPEKPPQASKAPDRTAAAAANASTAGGAMRGNSSTFLTGPSGIDPQTLNLGKNTLLGQ